MGGGGTMRQQLRREGRDQRDGTTTGGQRGGLLAAREPRVLELRVRPADLSAVAEVRGALRQLMARWDGPPGAGSESVATLTDVATLLVSELVTNALLHTRGGAQVTVTLTDRLRVEVRDCSAGCPEPRPPSEDGTSGRGLLLVRSLADDWGVRGAGAGKCVWFELGGGPV